MGIINNIINANSSGGSSAGRNLGGWNASTNTPTLPNPPTSPTYNLGDYYLVEVAGTQFGVDWSVNDKIIVAPNGENFQWNKETGGAVDSVTGNIVDNTDPENPIVTQVKSDWEQADITLPSHILNKPVILESLSDLDANGIIVRQDGGTVVNRSIVAGSERVIITNGDGVAGNPSIDIVEGGISVVANAGLDITDDEISTIYNTLEDDTVDCIAIGGLPATAASVLKTKTFVELFDEILFPIQNPTYTIPTIGLSASQTGNKEIGSTISQVLTGNAVKNDAGAVTEIELIRNSTQIAVQASPTGTTTTNIPAQFGFADPNNPNLSYSLGHTDADFVVVAGATNWKAEIDYNAGLAKKDNKGNDDVRTPAVRSVNAPQAAGTNFDSSLATVTGLYPYFYFVSDSDLSASEVATEIAAGNATKVLANANGTVSVNFGNASAKYLYFAHIAADTSKTKWYISDLNQGAIGGGSNLFGDILTNNVNSPESYWSAVSFKIYKTNYSTIPAGAIQFRNS